MAARWRSIGPSCGRSAGRETPGGDPGTGIRGNPHTALSECDTRGVLNGREPTHWGIPQAEVEGFQPSSWDERHIPRALDPRRRLTDLVTRDHAGDFDIEAVR